MAFWTNSIAGLRAVWYEVITKSTVVSWLVTSLLAALAGPFGTFMSQPFLWRLSYWAVVIGVAIVMAVALRVLIRGVFKTVSGWREDFVVMSFLSVLFGPSVYALNRWLVGPDAETGINIGTAILIVFAVSAAIIAVRHSMSQPNEPTARQVRARDRLLERIKAEQDAQLWRVSSDNHHIRIMTSDGQEHRILMRLRDAVGEIDVEPGFCVHRSHWVAQSSISRIVENDGRELVELHCGAHVPVGPKYRPNLVQAGVLSG